MNKILDFTDEEAIAAIERSIHPKTPAFKADPFFEGEKAYIVDDLYSVVFDSISDFRDFYIEKLKEAEDSDPLSAVAFVEDAIGKNLISLVSLPDVSNNLFEIFEKNGNEIPEQLAVQIKEHPINVLKMIFDLNDKKQKEEFFSYIFNFCKPGFERDVVNALIDKLKIRNVFFEKKDDYFDLFSWKTDEENQK